MDYVNDEKIRAIAEQYEEFNDLCYQLEEGVDDGVAWLQGCIDFSSTVTLAKDQRRCIVRFIIYTVIEWIKRFREFKGMRVWGLVFSKKFIKTVVDKIDELEAERSLIIPKAKKSIVLQHYAFLAGLSDTQMKQFFDIVKGV